MENGSPAQRAGIEPGDVILSFAGTEVERSGQLPALVATTKPGSEVSVQVWHAGRTLERKVRIGNVKEEVADAAGAQDDGAGTALGMAVRPLTGAERQAAHVVGGLVVEQVRNGPARAAGLRTGDVILAVNGALVSDADGLQRALQANPGRAASLLVQRGDTRSVLELGRG